LNKKKAWEATLANRGLVKKVLETKFAWLIQNDHQQLEYSDYFQVGLIGLYIAARRFDPKRKCRLSTYAYGWIYQGISREFRKEGFKAVRVPCYAYDLMSKLKKKHQAEFEQHLKSDAMQSAYRALGEPIALDAPLHPDQEDSPTLGQIALVCPDGEAIRNIQNLDRKRLLKKALQKLTDRERRIISLRFGIGKKREFRRRHLASIMGKSHQAIQQTEKKAFEKMRKFFGNQKIKKEDLI